MKEKQTPLMRQYNTIKSKYPETVLLFRLGDFFETFGDDAKITSKACGLTLTKRNNGAAGSIPLAGFPHHQLESYLPKLVKAGYRVAVCEQLEDPKQARGVVKRGVVEVVTPGVALYDKLLDAKSNNFAATLFVSTSRQGYDKAGFAACDVSTGEFFAGELFFSELKESLENIAPPELIISKKQKEDIKLELEQIDLEPSITKLEDWIFEREFAETTLLRHFETKSLKGFGIGDSDLAIIAAGALLHYASETRQGGVKHISSIREYNPSETMTLDRSTKRNLEILYSMGESEKTSSLLSVIDKTVTPMGGRLLKKWTIMPLKNLDSVNRRLAATAELFERNERRESLRAALSETGDLERLISKIAAARANPRDVVNLKNSLKILPGVIAEISSSDSEYLRNIAQALDPLDELTSLIDKAVEDEPSAQVGGGGVFRSGFSAELDSYVEAKRDGKKLVADFQAKQRAETSIPSLKVGFNNVFGYYIEITKTHSAKAPEHYVRKQTLTNSERYTTSELKEIETKLLGAEEKIAEIESNLFAELKLKISAFARQIQQNARLTARLDCILSFAQVSRDNNYKAPKIDESNLIEIKAGRHPVVEKLLPLGETFQPNDTLIDENERLHIITGPNMSGKSCYLRQVALIVLLGQIGCFVPAESARFGVVDRIFTRVGAQDNIASGESTFLVEMQETAVILNNATDKSLVLLDEVGRGTATFDGISIAWSISEFIHNNIGAKTLFATHYHELNELADRYENIVNYKVEAVEAGSAVLFSHKVAKGAANRSFGVHVAKMAGLPSELVDRANEIMKSLEGKGDSGKSRRVDLAGVETKKAKSKSDQLAIFEFRDDALREKLINLKINNITPVQALQILSDMKKEARKSNRK